MTRILGDIGDELARILEAERGSVSLRELLDGDGITPVYDIGGIAEAQLFCQDSRSFDTGNLVASASFTNVVDQLPPVFQLMGIFLTSDNVARINQVYVYGDAVGIAPGATRDDPLLIWVNGDSFISKSGLVNIGVAALTNLLVPPATRVYFQRGDVCTYAPAIKNRQGYQSINVLTTTTAFGAGTVRMTGHLVIGFFRRGRYTVSARPL